MLHPMLHGQSMLPTLSIDNQLRACRDLADIQRVEQAYSLNEAQKVLVIRQLLNMLDRETLMRVVDIFHRRIDGPAVQSDPAVVQAWPKPKTAAAAPDEWCNYTSVTAQMPPGLPQSGAAEKSDGAVQKQRLPLQDLLAARDPARLEQPPEKDEGHHDELDGQPSTFLFRNLPEGMTHAEALDWVDNMLGLKGLYNFFVLLPVRAGAKCRAAIINFINPQDTGRCQLAVARAPPVHPGLPRPVVMTSRQQGFESNREHYRSLEHFALEGATSTRAVASKAPETAGHGTIEETMDVSYAMIGRIIGKGGEMIKRLQENSGARVVIRNPDVDPCPVKLVGTKDAVAKVKQMVVELIENAQKKDAQQSKAQKGESSGGASNAAPNKSNVGVPADKQATQFGTEMEDFTTVILRNIPQRYDQEGARAWVDSLGYEGLYDFFLWFPAKMATRRWHNCGYAFINFKRPDVATWFLQKLQGWRFDEIEEEEEDEEEEDDEAEVSKGRKRPPLSVTSAKIQGFANNFDRFRYLLDGSGSCIPFFDTETLEENKAFQRPLYDAKDRGEGDNDEDEDNKSKTTLMIRNLPDEFTQEAAMLWLNRIGFENKYDFFLLFPAKQSQKKMVPVYRTFGYAFVNFLTSEDAAKCSETLQETQLEEGRPPVNVCHAKIQGLDANVEHFKHLESHGKCKAFVRRSGDDEAAPASALWMGQWQ